MPSTQPSSSSPVTTQSSTPSSATSSTTYLFINSSKKRCSLKEINEQNERCQFSTIQEPTCFEDTVQMKEWCVGMDDEIKALKQHNTWELVELPKGKEKVGLKWIYKVKYIYDGSIQKYIARLVARGYMQCEGIDFNETFAPIARFDTIRTVLAIAAHWKWEVYQFDVNSSFLNGVLNEEVFLKQPTGYEIKGEEEKTYRLNKALYGLK